MAQIIQSHVIAISDDPLDSIIEGTNFNAYLVANLAFNDGAEASANHYKLTLGQVYSAMAFYRDNEVAIDKSIEEMQQIGKELGARNASEHLAEIRARVKKD
jgi:uncharacterized protein (DUF433 family)